VSSIPATAPEVSSAHPSIAEAARQRLVMILTAAVGALLFGALLVIRPWGEAPAPPPAPSDATLVLTTNTVRITESYYAFASGFEPGEPVDLSWTGPTSGTMGAPIQADPAGTLRHGPMVERDLPGAYNIVAHGETSGRTATARLRVLPER
jgi:hypothetical protein